MDKKFNIKNYTTDVPADRSILEIERLLTLFGAEAIIKEYDANQRVHSLSFKLKDDAFKLPANIEGVKEILFKGKRPPPTKELEKRRAQKASRVAWRIIKDWTHSQLSLIASGQAKPLEIFLPYMFDGKLTFFEKFEANRLLPPKKGK